ncbi:MAG: hypothetical protein A2023_05790 [Sulfuricurvum sp. GWF2_44_89]|uniref:Uncharacterized protein n=1 Tax=Sulfuricurvum kujiense TaxID=148813 RepID=A0A2D3WDP2_9BACT|nr:MULTISPECIES: SiaB family protein kinase [Sulfuricurvum]OHD77425.1 MAG: hypothetical protein A2023_05790 [Sulfuricurvum sp. GWF2_44_89]OHD91216.1 MAG: hypothetical protein A2552_04390 [Sulfuricurvum sp. RIFOXYD2_FULL_44_160]OHD93224.1 MAG: hypothetical protein A2517_06280 [Sulfuricurvum sp. RIFOXYD12_FULL_44_77]DAB38548.1 MAG TPA: hypothetical protein CFH83_05370 [Sulfuricurvum kujiense]
MLAREYYGFKQSLDAKGIIVSFSGFVSEGILFSLGEALKQKMTLDETDTNTAKKVFSVFVEQVQNVIRYSSDRIEGDFGKKVALGSGTITVGHDLEKFFIVCSNTVSTADVPLLKERLEILKTMDKEGLKAYYKEKLREEPEAQSKGATIGLIEIARRSSEPIEFDFEKIDEERSFFCLKAYI